MMRNIRLRCWLIILFFMSNATFAAVSCDSLPLKDQDKQIIVPGVDKPRTTQIYFLQNRSTQSLWIDHPAGQHTGGAAGWSSYVRPGKWSALLLNRKNFALSCAVIQPGKVDNQNCAQAISICVPKPATFTSKRKGSYWLAEDLSWDEMLKILEKRGVQFDSKNITK